MREHQPTGRGMRKQLVRVGLDFGMMPGRKGQASKLGAAG